MHLLRLRLRKLDRHGGHFVNVRDNVVELKELPCTLAGFRVVFNVYKPVFSEQFDVLLANGVVCLAVGALFDDTKVEIWPKRLKRLDLSLSFEKILVGAFVACGSLLVLCDDRQKHFRTC